MKKEMLDKIEKEAFITEGTYVINTYSIGELWKGPIDVSKAVNAKEIIVNKKQAIEIKRRLENGEWSD